MKLHHIAIVTLITLGCAGTAAADGVFDVPQLQHKNPVRAQKIDESALAAEVKEKTQPQQDYQSQIMSNTQMNDRARAQAIIANQQPSAGDGGNVANIAQEGSNNKSSVTQKGRDNYVNHTQNGSSNDMFIDQQGNHNRSVQQQTGQNNHRVIIQNGQVVESATVSQQKNPEENSGEGTE